MGVFRTLAALIFVLCIPVGLFTSTVRYLVNEPRVYEYAIDNFGAVQTTGISRSELLKASAELRQYFRDNEDTVSIMVEQNGQQVRLFNPRETAHLKDVKQRLRQMDMAQEFSILYAIAYVAVVVLWAREVSTRKLAVLAAIGCALILALVGAMAGLSMTGFDTAWTRFHELIFTNSFWLLNPYKDHLIQMFPMAFWQNIVFLLGVLVASESALLLLSCGIYLGVSGRASARRELSPSFT